jgi:hypothetical protein
MVLRYLSSEISVTLMAGWNALPGSDTLLKLTLLSLHSTSSQTVLEAPSNQNTFSWCVSILTNSLLSSWIPLCVRYHVQINPLHFDYLQVHVQFYSITATRYISKLTRSLPPVVLLNLLLYSFLCSCLHLPNYGIQIYSIVVSKCIYEPTPFLSQCVFWHCLTH